MKYTDFKNKIKHLPVFSTSMLTTLTDKPDTLRVQLSGWKKKGLITEVRRGLYVLSPEERSVEPPKFYLANQIFLPSYVSLESALAYYGLIPEFVAATTSVTARRTCRFENAFGIFSYRHVKSGGFDGFQSIQDSDSCSALMATPAKAVVDFLYLNLEDFNLQTPDVFTESFRFQNGDSLRPEHLRRMAAQFGSKKLSVIVDLFIREVVHD